MDFLETSQYVAEFAAAAVELVGIAVVGLLTLYFLSRGAVRMFRGRAPSQVYVDTRRQIARSILLGLEFLVAADIIHTVAVELTFESVGVLAIVVVIRTFLSFTLEMESTGKWPWQQSPRGGGGAES
jgi:uncharacterized membrane protein